MMVDCLSSASVPVSEHLDDRQQDDLDEGDQLAADQPDVNHLDVGRRGQLVHKVGEDGCHHQHCGQVHRNSSLKVEGLEEGGGIGGEDEEQGGHVGGEKLAGHHPLEDDDHADPPLRLLQGPLCHLVLGEGGLGFHDHLIRHQLDCLLVQCTDCHINPTLLRESPMQWWWKLKIT